MPYTHFDVFPANKTILVKKFFWVFSQVVWFCFCRHQKQKAEPHYPAENLKELLHKYTHHLSGVKGTNSLVVEPDNLMISTPKSTTTQNPEPLQYN
jgi:hypothetical protein